MLLFNLERKGNGGEVMNCLGYTPICSSSGLSKCYKLAFGRGYCALF